jgi:hypothetical protein
MDTVQDRLPLDPAATHLLRWDLHGQITTCHHDAIRLAQDVVKVCQARLILNLGDDLDLKVKAQQWK